MNEEQIKIREQQERSWNKFSAGWKKWDTVNMDFIRAPGLEIIAALEPSGNQVILDIASGTGEPGLTIAGLLNGGKVIITDLAADMLNIAAENAASRNITNIELQQCDVCALPFEDNFFDAVSCRFGFMFFPDMQLAANEITRVLKPGGRIATSVWNTPDKNFWVTAMMGTISKNIPLPPPVAGAPGMFRCAQQGLLKGIFEKAGLKNIKEKEVATQLKAETPETYWRMMTEVGAPIVAALAQADEATIQQIKADVFQLLREKLGDGDLSIAGSAIVIAGQK